MPWEFIYGTIVGVGICWGLYLTWLAWPGWLERWPAPPDWLDKWRR